MKRHRRAARFAGWTTVILAALLGVTTPHPAGAAQVTAQLEPERIALGDAAVLVVAVEGAHEVETPRVALPPGLQLLGTERAQNFSWVNGKTTSQLQYRFSISADRAGTFPIGPVQVKVDGQELRSGMVALDVSAAPAGGGGGGALPGSSGGPAPATLTVVVEPTSPYVGQPILLRARLTQRAAFARDPEYVPPTTTGFWTDQPSKPSSYYADVATGRVLVTETRTRMFPLATGDATIGEATAQVAFAVSDPMDPFSGMSGAGREYTLRSTPVHVHVRPLPPGAPAGFGGAVGSFDVRWEADRTSGARDVPFTVFLNVRGRGNLPLIAAPVFAPRGLEVFAQTVDDSLGPPGETGPGRKRFQWTVLARREGMVELEAPGFSWFDPADGRYHVAAPPALPIRIGPPAYPGGSSSPGGYPAVLVENPVLAGERTVRPWVWGLAGALLASAAVLWRRGARRPVEAPERARALEWLRAAGTAQGPDFWRAAEDSVEWLGQRGAETAGLAADIRRARYGGAGADPDVVRARLIERLSAALPRTAGGAMPRVLAAIAVALAALLVVAVGWGPPMPGSAGALRQAETAARQGDLANAREGWQEAWLGGNRSAELAARLTWVELQLGEVGHATAWALRGRRIEPRNPALEWMAARAREAGGLLGAPSERRPIRAIEWAIAALVLGLAAGVVWPRRVPALVLALLALACTLTPELESIAIDARPLAVVTRGCVIDPGGLELQPGQVVRRLGRAGGRTTIRAGEERGTVPSDALEDLDAPPAPARPAS